MARAWQMEMVRRKLKGSLSLELVLSRVFYMMYMGQGIGIVG